MNLEAARAKVKNLESQSAFEQAFEYPLKLVCTKGSSGKSTIPIGASAHFQMFGYNISYTPGTDGALDKVSLQFGQNTKNRKWSTGKVNIHNIAVPGIRNATNPVSRYGFRSFPGLIPANDTVTVEWTNTDVTTDIEVDITLVGLQLFVK